MKIKIEITSEDYQEIRDIVREAEDVVRQTGRTVESSIYNVLVPMLNSFAKKGGDHEIAGDPAARKGESAKTDL